MGGTVLITGATAGIGQAAARRFVAEGWKVIATGRVTKMGGKLAYCDSELRDEAGTLIATGRAVMCFTGHAML